MSLKLISQIKAEIDANLPDNSTGLVTPATLRAVLQDMVDSLYSRLAGLFGAFPAPLSQSLTTLPVIYPVLTPTAVNNHPSLFTVNTATGKITTNFAGFGVNISLAAVFSAPANTDVYIELFKNNILVPRIFIADQGTGAGELKSVSYYLPAGQILVGDVFDVRLRSPQGPVSVAFTSLDVTIALQPTLTAV